MASLGHREAVLAELNAAHVPTTITPEELAGTVAQVGKLNLMTFSDEDLPSEGKGHNQALQITIGCNGYWVPHVLIDNGSGVNICTLDMTKMICVTEENIALGNYITRIVRGFDNEKKNVMDNDPEETDVNSESQITIAVIETDQGRKNHGEESVNLVVYRTPSKEKLPSWFDHGHTKIGHYLRKCRFFPSMGLGLRCNGPIKPISGEMIAYEVPFGLGYQPTEADRISALEEKRWKAILTKKGFIGEVTGLNWNHQPSLNGHFIRKGDSQKEEEEDEGIYEGMKKLFITSLEEEEEEVQVWTLVNLHPAPKKKSVSSLNEERKKICGP
ncbi:hypothetical protein BVC80_641g5 [Macleaya cordata]|uniref:G-patch domain n=1 Tax=Macleaya cordata TaxID=56857 RepID=A0A200QJT0_MACCD|nr:hypothetical protein BVC80_641g5 [Macleaya cordata]